MKENKFLIIVAKEGQEKELNALRQKANQQNCEKNCFKVIMTTDSDKIKEIFEMHENLENDGKK